MSPSRRQAIDDYQREIEEDYRKNQMAYELYVAKGEFDRQNNIEEYGEKKAIDYQYDRGLAAFKAGLKNSSGGSSGNTGSNLGIGQGTKYEGTTSNIKKTIKNNYDKNGDLSKAIEDIYANYPKSADREVAFEDILGMSEEEALESYDASTVSNVISTLEEEYGSISKSNREQLEAAIIYLTDSQTISKDIAEDALAEIDYEINYQDELKKYQDIQNKEIDIINNTKDVLWINTLKNAMEKSNLVKASNNVKDSEDILTDKLGKERYEKLLEETQNKDDEISKILKKRGIDW